MSVPYALLGLLEQQPRHGYDLKRLFDRYFAADHQLAFGQVYATLGRLSRDGNVVVALVDRDEGPERKHYAITASGTATLEDWFGRPIPPEPRLQSELFAKVTLAVLTGRPIASLLDAQRGAHLARMRELTLVRRTSGLPVSLLADYALFHLEADLRWIEMTGARIDDLRAQLRPFAGPGSRAGGGPRAGAAGGRS